MLFSVTRVFITSRKWNRQIAITPTHTAASSTNRDARGWESFIVQLEGTGPYYIRSGENPMLALACDSDGNVFVLPDTEQDPNNYAKWDIVPADLNGTFFIVSHAQQDANNAPPLNWVLAMSNAVNGYKIMTTTQRVASGWEGFEISVAVI